VPAPILRLALARSLRQRGEDAHCQRHLTACRASAACFCSAFRKVLQRNGKTSSLWLSGVVDGKITTLQRTQRLQLLREGKLEIKRRLVPGCEPPFLPLTEEDVEQFFGWHD